MADRSISIRLSANVSGLQAGLRTGARAARDFERDLSGFARRNEQQLDAVGKSAMVLGGVLVAGFGAAVKTFADFDKAMSSVQAATHESKQNMDLMRQAAIDAGADTAYSAEEAAGAIEELAKAGVSTGDILKGGLDGALSLAAAGALDVGEAAETAASAMTQFGLQGKDIPHIADLLAAGAGKAQGSVHDMGGALNQVGLVASQTGLTIEETTGGLAAFASAGLTGSDAGTSFKTMLQGITPNSEAASKAMDELGISAFDSQGNFIGLSEFAGVLQNSMKDLTAEQRNSTMETIFGSDAVRAAAVLYQQGAEGVQKWEDAVNDAGFAASTAAIMQDNLAGDLEKLGGAFDTVLLQSGSGVNQVLRDMTQGLEGVLDGIGQIPAPVLSAGATIAGVAGGAALLGGAALTALPRIVEFRDSLRTLAPAGSRARGALVGVGKAAGVAAGLLMAFEAAKGINNSLQPATVSIEEMTQALMGLDTNKNSLNELFANIKFGDGSQMAGEVNDIAGAMAQLTSPDVNKSMERFAADNLGISNGMSILKDTIATADQAMAAFVQGGNTDIAAEAFRQAADAAKANGEGLDQVGERFPQYLDSLRETASAVGETVGPQELLNWALTGTAPAAVAAADAANVAAGGVSAIGDAAGAATPSLEDVVAALFNLGMITMDSRAASAAFEGALDDAKAKADELAASGGELGSVLKQNGKDFDLTSEAGRQANEAFQNVAQSGMAEFEAKAKEGAGTKELRGSLQDTYNGLITAAGGFGITGKGAETLARQVLGVPDGVSISSWMSDAAKQTAEGTKQAVDNIPTYKEVTVHYSATGSLAAPGASNPTSPLRRAVGGPVFGAGTATSDSIPALLSNGEHVLTADEVQRMGGHAAVERMRAMAKAGLLPAFATGGRVGWSKREQADAKVDTRYFAAARKAYEKEERAAQKAYDRIDGTKENKAAKAAAKRALDAAKRATKRAKDDEAESKRKYEDAKARTSRLAEGTRDLKTDLRRGDIRDAVRNGNGLSVVDRLSDASRNADLSSRQRSNLAKVAWSSEKQLAKLTAQAEKLDKQLDSAKAKEQEFRQVKNQTRDSVVGTFDLRSQLGQKNAYGYDQAVTKGSLLSYGKQKAASAKKLKDIMGKLQKAGFRPELMQQVLEEWTSSGTFEIANALLSMSTTERKQMNQAFADTSTYGYQAGHRLTEAMYKGGLHAAEGLVEGLEDKQTDLNKAMTKLAKGMEGALRKAWGIHSPSRVMRGLMHHLGDGAVLGLDDKEPEVAKAAASMVGVPSGSFGGWSVAGASSRAVSAPVMELSAADRQIMSQFIQASQNMPPMKLVVGSREAGTIYQEGAKASGRLK